MGALEILYHRQDKRFRLGLLGEGGGCNYYNIMLLRVWVRESFSISVADSDGGVWAL